MHFPDGLFMVAINFWDCNRLYIVPMKRYLAHIFKELSANFPNCINTVSRSRKGLILHNLSYPKTYMLNLSQSRLFIMSKERETYVLKVIDIIQRSMSKIDVTDCSQVFVTDNFEDVLKPTNF